ncbi:MAG: alpha/beta hydrolase [Ignavibacteriae bacterium]|nr:alpha/beta hydrolase [Ignavibacteriota bacterium]
MKKIVFIFTIIAFYFNIIAQTDNRIVIGCIDSIQSKILNEQRKVWVYVPDQGASRIFSQQHYPVVYLLDGDAHFYSVVGMIQQLSSVNGNMKCPKMIVVGILNKDRTRDLTPTHINVELDPDPPYVTISDSAFYKTSGGGEDFIAFIEKELVPQIDAKYPTAPYKMLIGHSFGGLAVMQSFVHHINLFNSYICIDPSMWWDKQKLLKQAQKVLSENNFDGKSLYLGIANTLNADMDIKNVQNDTSSSLKHIRAILALQVTLEKNKQNGLKYKGKYYDDDTHGSVPLITTYDALRFFFDFYPLKLSEKDFTDSTSTLVNKYLSHFTQISKKMGYEIKPDEEEINSMGYDALERKFYKKAESFFKLNLQNYPESYNVYDSMGDYYEAIGDKSNAIKFFEKTLLIKEYPDTRKKLEKLQSK